MATERWGARAPRSARGGPGVRGARGAGSRARAGLPRWWRSFRRTSTPAQVISTLLLAALVAVAVNWGYQVFRKPSELLFPLSGVLYKTPTETWHEYGAIFKRQATPVITAGFLAALAQTEGSGNPVVRTYWRWSWTVQPFEIYRPASSAVGMYQITDGTFAEARRYCIHDHAVVESGAWHDVHSCWFNSLYARVWPSSAVELTAAYLDRSVATILARRHMTAVSSQHQQELAAVIHLCGAGAGDAYVRRGFRLTEHQRCGDHEVRTYVSRIDAMQRVFDAIAAREDGP